MLRFVALCFVAALASAFSKYSPERPDFGPVYSVRYDKTDLLRNTKYPYKLWFDEPKNMSLLEHYGAQYLAGKAGANTGKGRFILGFYVTTEKYLNRWNCWNQSNIPLAFDILFSWQRIMPIDHRFNFIGKDIVLGEEADKWRFAVPYQSFIYEYTTWVSEKELHGSQQAVPLRHEVRVFDEQTGEIGYHIIDDFYDFNTSAFDPEIFNIKRGLVNCSSGNWPVPREDQTITDFGERIDFPRLNTMRGPEIFRRHLRYPEALSGAGRAETQRATLRTDTPPDPSKRSGALPFPYSDAEVEALSEDLPEQFDWRPYGAVTAVKDQSVCLVSYAFCATDLVASALFVQKNRTRLMRLSDQAIIDCSWEYNLGCNGYQGLPATLEWITVHGLPTQVDYSEYQTENGYCHLADVKTAATIQGYINVPPLNENALKVAILLHGPVAVGIDAYIYNNYNGGVYNDTSCTWGIEYCLAVGWGVLDGQKYWIVKAPNNHRWGIDGYALIAIDKNICGVMREPVFVVV